MVDQYLEFCFHVLKPIPEGRFAVEVGLGEVEGEEVVLRVEVVDAFPHQSLEVLGGEEDQEGGVEATDGSLDLGVDFSVVEDVLHPDQQPVVLASQIVIIALDEVEGVEHLQASYFDEVDDGYFAGGAQLVFEADQYILEFCERLGVDLEGEIYEYFFSLLDLLAAARGVGDCY